jgi:hypothetical protein
VNATRTRKRADRLGYKIEDTGQVLILESPKGYSFWDDFHALVSNYEHSPKSEAWRDIFEHIGLAELCGIEECDYCDEDRKQA